ncbi:hypothetical protein BASA50_002314 [Batrachochytrium salamandrivorans]|uniref:EamA domain-containing protein n=1 Tax=Batrachochytrium salamandrivorans TaxID=1357716 RepID=A0ABQ8FMY6_9FUNG|nr:hypothetical protein BASA50_002314 [Batrachochytrium salamandrivorans]KAH9276716.1 hypothetical protein BASA83_000850 [Batrachochytrium salamandrivorans]
MGLGDIESIVGLFIVAVCWGFTNPFIKSGSKGLEEVSRAHADSPWWQRQTAEIWFLGTRWQYVLPLAVNLCGSTVYYYTLGDADLSLAVPITNSLTLALTALAGIALGESFGSWRKLWQKHDLGHTVRVCVRLVKLIEAPESSRDSLSFVFGICSPIPIITTPTTITGTTITTTTGTTTTTTTTTVTTTTTTT